MENGNALIVDAALTRASGDRRAGGGARHAGGERSGGWATLTAYDVADLRR